MSSSCLYTAQGVLVCDQQQAKKEHFYVEEESRKDAEPFWQQGMMPMLAGLNAKKGMPSINETFGQPPAPASHRGKGDSGMQRMHHKEKFCNGSCGLGNL
jgi:hypothetical protein